MSFRGNRPKKKKQSKSLYYPYTNEDIKRVGWCLERNIAVAVVPISLSTWRVEIRLNKGNWKQDPKEYEHEEAMKKMYEYYKYYYDKHRN